MKIEKHLECVKILENIKDEAFEFIKKNLGKVSEYDVMKFILDKFSKESLIMDSDEEIPIVAVNSSSSQPHYYPNENSRIINPDSLILIDIWARLDKGYFGDITWMGFSGKTIPKEIQNTFNHVIKARNLAIKFIEEELSKNRYPRGIDVDNVVRNYFKKYDIEKYFIHGTGHSLGLQKCHGEQFNLNQKGEKNLMEEVPFTIEPGIYYNNKFGVRSEIDCYIKNKKLKISGKIQDEIILI